MKQGDTKSLPNGWEIKHLCEVCEVIAGQSPESKYYNSDGVGLPFYQGKKEFKSKYIGRQKKWTSKITKEAIEGDLLMSVRAPVGPINFSTQHICIGRGLAAIRAGELVDKEFLYNFLIKHENEIVGNTGAVFNSINKTQIGDIPIPIPPLDEQKRIVAKLDQCFAALDKARANVERNLKNAKELFQSQLNQIFSQRGDGWVEKKLGEIANFRNGLNFTKNSNGEKIKIVGVKDFQKNFWIPFDTLNEVEIDGDLNQIDYLKKNDIITVRSNGNPKLIGRCILADVLDEKISHSGFTIRIRMESKKLYSPFLCHFLKTQKARSELIESGTGISIKSLTQGSLSSLYVPYPSLLQQKTLVENIDELKSQTQSLESQYEQELDALDELKKSILQKAFRGEL